MASTLAMIAALAAAVVMIRSEQARCARRVQCLRSRQIKLEREGWSHQAEMARLRTPAMIRERVERMRLCVAPPRRGADVRVADARATRQ